MQNKGAIRLFAILLALACAFYLMFTWVAAGIEKDGDMYAKGYTERADIKAAAEKSSANTVDQRTFLDSVLNARTNFYKDSIKKLSVIDALFLKYTYDEVKDRQLNLGLDLKGGMNVTLEVSVPDLIRGLSNNSNDPAFNQAIDNAVKRQVNDSKDFVTLFGEEYHKINPTGKLAIDFNTIELKGKI